MHADHILSEDAAIANLENDDEAARLKHPIDVLEHSYHTIPMLIHLIVWTSAIIRA
jgi:hypothetical protein